MADRADITPEICRQLLRYEPETGLFFWHARPREMFESDRIFRSWNTKWAGMAALNTIRCDEKTGYACFIGGIFNRKHKAHRVAWAMSYGEWPDEIDHINGDALDNRINNLRSVTHHENCLNRRMPRDNQSGVFGVYWSKRHNRWLAKIKIPATRRYKHLGLFDNIEAASSAVEAGKLMYGYHKNHGRQSP